MASICGIHAEYTLQTKTTHLAKFMLLEEISADEK
jgi:hypothetical protein